MQANGAPETDEEWLRYYAANIISGVGLTKLQIEHFKKLLDKGHDHGKNA